MSEPKRVEDRSRQRNWSLEQRQEGYCPVGCGNRLDINPRTGKPYYRCKQCREKIAVNQKLLMRGRRAAGIAD